MRLPNCECHAKRRVRKGIRTICLKSIIRSINHQILLTVYCQITLFQLHHIFPASCRNFTHTHANLFLFFEYVISFLITEFATHSTLAIFSSFFLPELISFYPAATNHSRSLFIFRESGIQSVVVMSSCNVTHFQIN